MKKKLTFILVPCVLILLPFLLKMKGSKDEQIQNPHDEKAIYTKILADSYPDLLNRWDNPDINTLRALKTAGDLREMLGDLSQFHIAEIGGGDRRQCEILAELGGFASYTIIDSPENFHTLSEVSNIHFADISLVGKKPYDLVIANTPFLDYPPKIQEYLLRSVLESASHGYLQVDQIHYSLKEHPLNVAPLIKTVRQQGKKGSIMREHPLIDRYLMRWSPPPKQKGGQQNGSLPSKRDDCHV